MTLPPPDPPLPGRKAVPSPLPLRYCAHAPCGRRLTESDLLRGRIYCSTPCRRKAQGLRDANARLAAANRVLRAALRGARAEAARARADLENSAAPRRACGWKKCRKALPRRDLRRSYCGPACSGAAAADRARTQRVLHAHAGLVEELREARLDAAAARRASVDAARRLRNLQAARGAA